MKARKQVRGWGRPDVINILFHQVELYVTPYLWNDLHDALRATQLQIVLDIKVTLEGELDNE